LIDRQPADRIFCRLPDLVIMFSRRHPFLFFFLTLAAIVSATGLAVTVLVIFWGTERSEFGGEKVGVIEITGTIADAKPTIEQIIRFRDEESIKAIVVRIDSPGGAVGPSQEIYRELKRTSAQKKVIASMGAVAASGGYYVAAGTDGIVANPGTVTGSIGVIMGYTNFEELLKKICLVPVVIKSGQYKDVGSPVRTMSEKERELLQGLVKKIHQQFVAAIAEGRKLELSKVESIADGRIFTGEEALDLGLVDRLGNLQDAIQWAGQLGGIKGKASAHYAREEKLSFLRYLLESSLQNLLRQTLNSEIQAQYLFRP
jgi:protease-4